MSPGERLLADPAARLQHARDLAWAALNRREHTVAELRRRLYEQLRADDDSFVDNPWMRDQLLTGRKLSSR